MDGKELTIERERGYLCLLNTLAHASKARYTT